MGDPRPQASPRFLAALLEFLHTSSQTGPVWQFTESGCGGPSPRPRALLTKWVTRTLLVRGTPPLAHAPQALYKLGETGTNGGRTIPERGGPARGGAPGGGPLLPAQPQPEDEVIAPSQPPPLNLLAAPLSLPPQKGPRLRQGWCQGSWRSGRGPPRPQSIFSTPDHMQKMTRSSLGLGCPAQGSHRVNRRVAGRGDPLMGADFPAARCPQPAPAGSRRGSRTSAPQFKHFPEPRCSGQTHSHAYLGSPGSAPHTRSPMPGKRDGGRCGLLRLRRAGTGVL